MKQQRTRLTRWLDAALWSACALGAGAALGFAGGCSAGGDGNTLESGGSGQGGSGANGGSGGSDFGGFGGSGGSGGSVEPIGPAFEYDDPGATGAYKDPSLPDDIRERFSGATTADGAAALVYPLAESMHPMNLGQIAFHFSQGSAQNTVFRIDVSSADAEYHFYVPCTDSQCVIDMPRNEWLTLGQRFAGQPFTVRLLGSDGQGGVVTESAQTALEFSPGPVAGALYYWASKNRTIKRATFGSHEAVDYIIPNSATNDYACVACHSVSRDGKTIAFAVAPEQGEDIAAIQTAPTDDPTTPYVRPPEGPTPFPTGEFSGGNTQGPTNYFGHNVALSPDGSMAAINGVDVSGWPPYFELRETKTGTTIQRWDLGDPLFGAEKLPILPEWSPDGNAIAVTLADATGDTDQFGCVWTSDTCRSGIAILGFSGGVLSAPKVLVPQSGNDFHYYPTWSPDGKWLAFMSATRGSNDFETTSEATPNGLIRMVRTAGGPYTCPGSDCIELTRGTLYSPSEAASGLGKKTSWPKFAPFSQAGDQLFFISFNTRADYGFLASDETQLWMFAVDVSKVGSGDPSYPPFWLPYQDFEDGSLTAYWTETLPCQADPQGGCAGCVGSETCVIRADNTCHCETVPR
ncbi:MAG: hypothetical protein R3B07_24610 [Polyangiaceae bacterium]